VIPKRVRVKLLILDFDGVLVESVKLKQKVFAEVFSTLLDDKVAKDAIAFSLKFDSLSRDIKFKFALSIQKSNDSDKLTVENLDYKFNKIMEKQRHDICEVDGASELLCFLNGKIPIHICSSAPKDEILGLLRKFSWESFIKEIHSTSNKTDTINGILVDLKLKPHDVVFVGDSENDEMAATQNGIWFIPRIGSGNNYTTELNSVKNMRELISILMLEYGL
jgi:phosphoglycolate phosphatase-like HAD superfamily hydrolase